MITHGEAARLTAMAWVVALQMPVSSYGFSEQIVADYSVPRGIQAVMRASVLRSLASDSFPLLS